MNRVMIMVDVYLSDNEMEQYQDEESRKDYVLDLVTEALNQCEISAYVYEKEE